MAPRFLLLAAAVCASAAPGAPLSWQHLPPGCPAPMNGGFVVACGDLGTYTFGGEPAACAGAIGNVEDVKAYPPPSGYNALPVEEPPLIFGLPLPATPPAPGAVPVRGSSGPDTGGWGVVLDWSTWHGWSIGWLIHQLAGAASEVVFLDLQDPRLAPLGPTAGDAHVLANLCDVLQAVDSGSEAPPRVVNMSFGRHAGPKEKLSGASCSRQRLSCHLTGVIEALVARGTLAIAAAGNHRSVLYPAALDAVVEVGSLDLERLAAGTFEAGWESAPASRGLAAGDGLCIRGGWSAPAGTSFASAVLAGWILGLLDEEPMLDGRTVLSWGPAWNGACYLLAADDVTYGTCASVVTQAANDVIELALDPLSASSPCASAPPDLASSWTAWPSGPGPAPRFLSHDQWVASGVGPAPAPDPCIPCMGSGGGFGALVGGETRAQRLGADDLVIDRSSSQALPAHLRAVYLRVADVYYHLGLSDEVLQQIEAGRDDALVVEGGMLLVDEDRQPSLYYIATTDPEADCADPADVGKCFWTSSPIDLLD